MKVAIMQPYFFPYLGYWQLMALCDQWVFFDSVQFNKRSWMSRNRILHPDPEKEFQYINLGTEKSAFGQSIFHTQVKRDHEWRYKILSQLEIYHQLKAPYYLQVIDLAKEILFSEAATVSSQAEIMAKSVMRYLELNTKVKHSSKIEFDKENVGSPGDWAFEISRALGASVYINPANGAGLFDEQKFDQHGIRLAFLKSNLPNYPQSNRKFVPGLSILDVLMFNSQEDVAKMMNTEYLLLDKTSLV